MEYKFEFVVSGLEEAEVDELLEQIILFVEGKHGAAGLGGGFSPVSEAEEGDDEQVDG